MLEMPNFNEKGGIDFILSKFKLLTNGIEVPFVENEFLELVNFYITNNELDTAYLVFKYAINLFPNKFDIKLIEAQLLIESGRYSLALKKLKNLYKIEPNNLSLLMLIGLNYSNIGSINKSISFYNKAVNLVPEESQGLFMYNIAQTYINSENFKVAIFYLNKARIKKLQDEQIILDLAYCMERTKQYSNSEKLFNIYLKKNPFSEIAWYNLGVVLTKLDKTEKAFRAYDFAIAIDPTFSTAIFNKANLFFDNNNYKEAITYFNHVIEYEQQNSEAFLMRGISYFYTNKMNKAAKDIKSSLKINENSANAWYYLSQIYFNISLKHSKKALYRAICLDNTKSSYWNFAAKIFHTENKHKFADIAFMHSVSFNPFVDNYWFDYSDYKKNKNNFKDAISILKIGKDFVSDNYSFYLKMSSLFLSIDDKKNAQIHFNNAYKIDRNALSKIFDIHENKEQINFLINLKK